jgi:hypothetical protein
MLAVCPRAPSLRAHKEPSPDAGVAMTIPGETIMRSLLLWLIGVPIPIIIILWLITGHA